MSIYIKTVYALRILGTLTVVVKLKHLTVGGDERDRTADPLLARQVLSQLSYTPVFLNRARKYFLLSFFTILKVHKKIFLYLLN